MQVFFCSFNEFLSFSSCSCISVSSYQLLCLTVLFLPIAVPLILKLLNGLMELRLYIEYSFILADPKARLSDHMGEEYNIIDVIVLDNIFLFNRFGHPMFDIIAVSSPCLSDDFSPMNFTCSLKYNL